MKKSSTLVIGPRCEASVINNLTGAKSYANGTVVTASPSDYAIRQEHIKMFIDDVIPTNEMSNVVTKADVVRIVANAPIVWDEQEYEQYEVANYLWKHRSDYQVNE